MNKVELRNKFLHARSLLSTEQVEIYSKQIEDYVLAHHWVKQSDTIFTFISKDKEVDTRGIIDFALKNDKRVAVPKVVGQGVMEYFYISSWEDVEKGKFGIYEPKEHCDLAISHELGVFLIPGLVYNHKKYRIGYGGGYFDRYLLKHNPIAPLIGICYSFQMVQYSFHEEYDVPVDCIITDEEVIS